MRSLRALCANQRHVLGSRGPLRRALLAAVALVALSLAQLGCQAPISVQTAYDHAVDFGHYQTFCMREPNEPVPTSADVDPFTMQRYRQLTYEALARRGLRPAGMNEAQLVVSVLGVSRDRVEVYSRSYPSYAYAGPAFSYDVRSYREGTVVIDLIDRVKNTVIWRGAGSREVRRVLSDEEKAALVGSIVARYPPRVPK